MFVSLATARSAEPIVAFTARIYYPPGDRRIARHQVYVGRLDGSRRQRVSSNRFDCDGVRWIGDHQLAWIEYQPGNEDSIGFRGDESKPQRLVLFNLQTGRTKTAKVGNWSVAVGTPGWSSSATWTRGEGLYSVASTVYLLSGSGLNVVPAPTDPYVDGLGSDVGAEWKLSGFPTVQLLTTFGPEVKGTEVDGGEWGSQAPIFRRNGKEHTFLIGPEVTRLVPSHRNPDISWCVTGNYAGSAGSHEWIYQLNWKTDKAKCVVSDLLDIDFQPDNRYYAGITTNKVTRPLGKKEVWARDVVAGDLETGKRWIVLGGLVHATSVSIQPVGVSVQWKRLGRLELPFDDCFSVSPNGKEIAYGGWARDKDGAASQPVMIHDLSTHKSTKEIVRLNQILMYSWTADSQKFAVAGGGKLAVVSRTPLGWSAKTLPGEHCEPCFSADGSALLTSSVSNMNFGLERIQKVDPTDGRATPLELPTRNWSIGDADAFLPIGSGRILIRPIAKSIDKDGQIASGPDLRLYGMFDRCAVCPGYDWAVAARQQYRPSGPHADMLVYTTHLYAINLRTEVESPLSWPKGSGISKIWFAGPNEVWISTGWLDGKTKVVRYRFEAA